MTLPTQFAGNLGPNPPPARALAILRFAQFAGAQHSNHIFKQLLNDAAANLSSTPHWAR